jgi:hypothetical protein
MRVQSTKWSNDHQVDSRTLPEPVESHILNSLRSLKALLLALPILPARRSRIASIIDSSRSLRIRMKQVDQEGIQVREQLIDCSVHTSQICRQSRNEIVQVFGELWRNRRAHGPMRL